MAKKGDVEINTEEPVVETIAETGFREEEGEPRDAKQVSWNKLGNNIIAHFPSGKMLYFDFTKLDGELMKYYGAKQFLGDAKAGTDTEADAIASMKSRYMESVEKGLALSETGKILVKGRERKATTSEDKILATKVKEAAKAITLEGLVMKKTLYPDTFTDEDQAKLTEFLAIVAKG